MRCPAGASRRQGCDLEPQLDIDVISDNDEELAMNCWSDVTVTTQDRLSWTTINNYTVDELLRMLFFRYDRVARND